MSDCIFCRIASKEIPAQILHEDDICVIFPDIHPKANTHLLIIPKKHIPTIMDLEEGDEAIIGHMIKAVKDYAASHNIIGYKLQFNVGEGGGQEVYHVHMHFTSANRITF